MAKRNPSRSDKDRGENSGRKGPARSGTGKNSGRAGKSFSSKRTSDRGPRNEGERPSRGLSSNDRFADKKPRHGKGVGDDKKPRFRKDDGDQRSSSRSSSSFGKGREDSSPRFSKGKSFRKDDSGRSSDRFGDKKPRFRKDDGDQSSSSRSRSSFGKGREDSSPRFSKGKSFRKDDSERSSDRFGDKKPRFRKDDGEQSSSSRSRSSFGKGREDSTPRFAKGKSFRKDDSGKSSDRFGDKKPRFKKDDGEQGSSSRPRSSFGKGREDSSPRFAKGKSFRKDDSGRSSDRFGDKKPRLRKDDGDQSSSSRSRSSFGKGREDSSPRFAKGKSFSKDDNYTPIRKESSGSGKDRFSSKKFSDNEDRRERRGTSGRSKERSESDNKEKYAVESAPQTEKIRLNRYIANSGVCSRREADELITMGLISVNGKTITELGFKVNPGDQVRYEDKLLKAEKPVYILLNKPKGYLTTTSDPEERKTVMHLVANAVKERVYPVGRLDRNTTGLLLLTNDGDLAEKLMHPSYNVKKIYKVELDRPLTKADLQRLLEGVDLEEGKAMVDDAAIISEDGKTVGIELHIGWNRVVRRIFESMEYQVVKLDRSVYAGLDKKDLPRGHWRFLHKEEIVRLKHYK